MGIKFRCARVTDGEIKRAIARVNVDTETQNQPRICFFNTTISPLPWGNAASNRAILIGV